jgi:hypothetical protein
MVGACARAGQRSNPVTALSLGNTFGQEEERPSWAGIMPLDVNIINAPVF